MAEFGKNIEDKFKLSLLSIEKRFVELEGAIGEIQQKMEALPTTDTKDLEQRISDLEDLIYVEQAGIEELKGILEKSQTNGSISAEEVQRITEPIAAKVKADLEAKIEQVKSGLGQQPNSEFQAKEMSDKLMQLEMKLRALHHFRAELDTIKNKVEPLNPEVIKSIVAEISDLRIETGREIREIKDKVGNTPLYADIEFLSNRVKDLKLTVDNMLNMKVQFDSKLLNMERNMAEGGVGSSSVASNLIDEIEGAKKELFEMEKRIASVDNVLKDFMKKEEGKEGDKAKQNEMSREIEVLYSKMNDLYADVERKAMDMNRLAPVDFENKISDFNSKIAKLENELNKLATEKIGDKFGEIRGKISKIEEQVSNVSSEKINERIFETNSKISRIEADLKKISSPDAGNRLELNSKISKLQEDVNKLLGEKISDRTNARIGETNARISKLHDEINRIAGTGSSGKNEIASKIARLEERVHVLGSRPKEVRSPAYEDQMKELLEKIIFLETRVNVLETSIREPQKMEPIILE